MRSVQPSASTTELIRACARGEAGAWDVLLDRYERLVFTVAIREGLAPDDAADVTQITFEALLAQLDRIRDEEQIASWLATVARRQAWRLRDERRRVVPEDPATTTLDEEEVGFDPIEDRGTMMWVYDGLSKLEEACRSLLFALYFDPGTPSYAEVANRLGRPVGSIGPTRARCLQRLRKILEGVDWP